MLRVYRARDLSRAQLLGGPVKLSEHAQGQSISAFQRDHGPVRLSDMKQPLDAAQSDAFEKSQTTTRR